MKKLLFSLAFLCITTLAFSQPVNDVCSSATTITVLTASASQYTYNTTTATQTALSSCDNVNTAYQDVWFEFTMPVNGNIRITNLSLFDGVTLYDGCGGTEISCFYNNGFIYNLTLGNTYILRMNKRDIYAGSVTFNIQAFATSANDECADKETISVTTAEQSYTYDTRTATESVDSSCDVATNINQDVWYDFTMPVNGNVRITNLSLFDGVTLYDDCSGTELSCFYNSGFLYGLTSGTNYTLRMSRRELYSAEVTFKIQAFENVANDECAGRQTISVTTTEQSYTYDTRTATESIDSSCDTASNINQDLWFGFTMPVNGNVRITNISLFDGVTLYDGCGGTELNCFYNNGFLYGLTAGTEYVLRMNRRELYSDEITFKIQAFEEVLNDECEGRETISVTTELQNYTYDTRAATESLDSSCDNTSNNNLDIWYQFTMPVNGNVRITNISLFDGVALYDGCGGTELSCFNNNGFLYGLTADTDYILRMSRRSIYATEINFNIQAFEASENDLCENALESGIGVTSPTTITTDTRAATAGAVNSCENSNQILLDNWFTFEMPFDGTIQVTGSGIFNNITLYDGCGGTEITCFNGNGNIFNVPGNNTYKLRVSTRDIYAGVISFNIQAQPSPLSPCNETTIFENGVWSNGLPDITKNVIIRSTLEVSDGGVDSFSACTLLVENNAELFIDGFDYVTVANNIIVDGSLLVERKASLVQIADDAETQNFGNITVRVETPPLRQTDFMIFGSPMTAETRNGVFQTARMVRNHITENFVPNADVAAQFPNAENFADDDGDNWVNYTGAINVGEGYLIRSELNTGPGTVEQEFQFNQGTLNSGDITFNTVFNTSKSDSPNMLSNPYPSPIFAGDLINANSAISEVYFWEHISEPNPAIAGYQINNFSMEDVSMYNLSGGVAAAADPSGINTRPNGIISTSQGFGIKANNANPITFNNSMRRATGNTTLRRGEDNRIWLNVTSEATKLQGNTLVGFFENTTEGIDEGYDSKKMGTFVSLYSTVTTGEELGIQAKPKFSIRSKVQLGFSTLYEEQSDYTISISTIEGAAIQSATAYLYDSELNIITNLSTTDYTFTASPGDYKNRFTLYFEGSISSISESLLPQMKLYPNTAKENFSVYNDEKVFIEKIKITDLSGRLVKEINVQSATTEKQINISNFVSATYLVIIETNKGNVIKRVLKE